MFKKAKTIWYKNALERDDFADFSSKFAGKTGNKYILNINCDSDYNLYVNGTLAGFGQYASYPGYQICDTLDISPFVKEGENTLCIIVWYYGVSFSTYSKADPGLTFELFSNGETLLCSDENTLCRADKGYGRGKGIIVSPQLGFRYAYNAQTDDDWYLSGSTEGFEPAVVVNEAPGEFFPRPIKKTVLGQRIPAKYVMQGNYVYGDEPSAAKRMDKAFLSHTPLAEISSAVDGIRTFHSDKKGIWFIVDLGAETVGFLDFDIEVPENTTIDIGYGEHLVDGRCRTSILVRDFSVTYEAKKGKNTFLGSFRRLGCRYLQFFADTTEIKVTYAGMRPVDYPVTVKDYSTGNLLRDEIYSACVRTLTCCMHDHYEDCPWREQSLYTLDSRNQMLCGYYAFGEYAFPRANLKLIAKSLGSENLLAICAPGPANLYLTTFSLIYFIQMREYIDYSGDTTLAVECFPVLEKILSVFEGRLQENGLISTIPNFSDEAKTWNFYEWVGTMEGTIGTTDTRLESPLNAFFSIALSDMIKICKAIGKPSEKYEMLLKNLNKSIFDTFYDADTKLFHTICEGPNKEIYSALTQALCLLCGAAEKADTSLMLKVLSENAKGDYGVRVMHNSLSMNCFRYDALLAVDREKYKNIILNEIDSTYLKMLKEGATTFWETEAGERDFGRAGSLCHGWSALPVYYYHTLL